MQSFQPGWYVLQVSFVPRLYPFRLLECKGMTGQLAPTTASRHECVLQRSRHVRVLSLFSRFAMLLHTADNPSRQRMPAQVSSTCARSLVTFSVFFGSLQTFCTNPSPNCFLNRCRRSVSVCGFGSCVALDLLHGGCSFRASAHGITEFVWDFWNEGPP